MEWQIVIDSLPQYAGGLRTTLVLLVISLASSFTLAIPLAIARVSARFWAVSYTHLTLPTSDLV